MTSELGHRPPGVVVEEEGTIVDRFRIFNFVGDIVTATRSGAKALITFAVDAAHVTFTPGVLADWDSSADPGQTDDALDQLAERIKDVEGATGVTVDIDKALVLTPVTGAPAVTAGCGPTTEIDSGTEDVNFSYFPFDSTTQEYAFWQHVMPANWNGGTVNFRIVWTTASAIAAGVVWGLKARSFTDDDAMNQAFGTQVNVTDTVIANGDIHITDLSAAVTIAGTPAANELVEFTLTRVTGDAADTSAADARFIALVVDFTVSSIILGHAIQDDNVDMADRSNLSFQDGFVLTDDAGGDQTEVDLSYAGTGDIADVTKAAESAGSALTVARGDHKHDISTASASAVSDIGDAAAEGSDTSLARSDHQHAFTAPGAGYPLDVAAAEADGTATTPARSDHVHAHPSLGSGNLHPEYQTPAEHTAVGDASPHHAEAHTVASHTTGTEDVQDIVGAMLTGNTETDVAVTYQDSDGTIDFVVNQTPTRTLTLTAAGGAPTTTAGCAEQAKVEAGTNDIDYWVLDFDATTQEYAFWTIVMPDNYDAGTLTARFVWTAASGSGGVRWGIAILSRSDDDAIDTAYGTAVEVSDTLLAAGDVHISAATSAITPGGTAAAGDKFFIRAYRLPTHADDTLAVDARLMDVKLEYTTSAYSD